MYEEKIEKLKLRIAQQEKCVAFFKELTAALSDSHVRFGSCNNDCSAYLIPIGTESQVTYHSKPNNSFRVSDHWNWYANVKKCPKEHYIQCYTRDMPWTKPRIEPGKPSKPIYGSAVAYFNKDGLYEVVYGEKFDRKTRTWCWVENSIEDVIAKMA